MKKRTVLLFGVAPRKAILRLVAVSALLTALFCVSGQLFLRNFYRLLEFDENFCGIFKQISLSEVTMVSPLLTVTIAVLLSCFAICSLWQGGAFKKTAAIILTALLALLITVLSVMLTRVNGVMFVDVVRTLVPLLTSGAL